MLHGSLKRLICQILAVGAFGAVSIQAEPPPARVAVEHLAEHIRSATRYRLHIDLVAGPQRPSQRWGTIEALDINNWRLTQSDGRSWLLYDEIMMATLPASPRHPKGSIDVYRPVSIFGVDRWAHLSDPHPLLRFLTFVECSAWEVKSTEETGTRLAAGRLRQNMTERHLAHCLATIPALKANPQPFAKAIAGPILATHKGVEAIFDPEQQRLTQLTWIMRRQRVTWQLTWEPLPDPEALEREFAAYAPAADIPRRHRQPFQ